MHDLYLEPQDNELDGGSFAGGIYHSTDDGATWSELHDFGAAVVWLAIDPNDQETLYASVVDNSQGGIHVTHNLSQGTTATFAQLPSPARSWQRPFNIRVLNDGTLVTSWSVRAENDEETFSETSGIFVSLDGGQTWQDRSHPNMTRWTMDVVIDPNDPAQNLWYAAVRGHQSSATPTVSDTGGLYRTTDRGLSWTRILDNVQAARPQSITVDPTNPATAYVTTEGNGLLVTQNLTAANPTFVQDLTYPFRGPVRVFFNPHDTTQLWTTTFGNGVLLRSDPTLIFADGFESGTASRWTTTVP